MLACALFNEQNKEAIPLSIIIMICIRKTVQAKKVYLPWLRAKTLFEEIVKDELKRVKQNLSNATRDENLGHDCKVLFKCILSVANFEETSKIESALQLLLHLQTFCVENFVYTLPILYSQRIFLLFVYTLKSLSQTVRNHDALLNCEPQLRKVVSPTQNHSRQIKSIIYIPVITIKLIVAKITIIALPILKHNLMENLLSPCGAIKWNLLVFFII